RVDRRSHCARPEQTLCKDCGVAGGELRPNDLRNRFEDEDRAHQKEIDAQAQAAEDQWARGAKFVRERYTMPPERLIHSRELECIKVYRQLVSEIVDKEELPSIDFDALYEDLLTKKRGSSAKLVRFMRDRTIATFEDVMKIAF